MNNRNIVYKCVGYFKKNFYCAVKTFITRPYCIEIGCIYDIYIELKDDYFMLLIGKDLTGSAFLCSCSNFSNVYNSDYSYLLFKSGMIYFIYVKIINGKVYFCEKEDDEPIWPLCSLNCFTNFYNGSIEKYFHNFCFVLKN